MTVSIAARRIRRERMRTHPDARGLAIVARVYARGCRTRHGPNPGVRTERPGEACLPSLADADPSGDDEGMSGLGGFVKKYPIVVATIVVLVAVLLLVATGQEPIGKWVATVYVAGIVVWTSIDMIRDILRGHFGLDILAVIAMAASLAVGEYLAALIIVLMLSGGEALEDSAAARATRDLDALLDRAPRKAHRLRADHDAAEPAASGADAAGDEQVEDLDVDEVGIGDVLLVKPAEVLPVDGVLLSDGATLDESSLTGESLPVQHAAGDRLLSGAVNGEQAFRMRATATAADSQYQQIIQLVAQAEQSKAPTVRIADRFAVPFTLVSLVIAGLAWWLSGDPVRFAEVLVLATPCPLLIAAPVAFMGGMSRSARTGVIVKGGATLEGLARAKSAAFDKTGTLSHGEPTLTRILPARDDLDAAELLRLAASAEQYSTHAFADGILAAARERGLALATGRNAREIATNGVTATVDGHEVVVGKLSFVRERDPSATSPDLAPGETAVSVAIDGRFAGSLVLADALRDNAADTVAELRRLGFARIAMLTGDNPATAAALAAQCGIDEVHASLLPRDKVELVAELPAPSIMVGDGINDAPVLAAAGVGIAMGARGATAASESADAVIVRDDIGRVVDAVRIGRRTMSVALQSIWIGIILSIGLMLVAAFGFIPAVAGALIQELIDLAAILSALRSRVAPRSA